MRTRVDIARQCRIDRIVDAWVSQWHKMRALELRGVMVTYPEHPREWGAGTWGLNTRTLSRASDSPPDASMRAAVIAEIDAIADALDRRKA